MRLLVVLMLIFCSGLSAQSISPSSYVFSVSTGTLTPSSGFTTLIGSNHVNAVSSLYPFGNNFLFNYSGVSYDSFSVSSSGWLRLGAAGTQQSSNLLALTTNYPVISPYGAQLNTSSTGWVGYQILGSYPYRACIIQWQSVYDFPYISTPVNFEVRLHESSGKIEFIYGSIPVNGDLYNVGIGAKFNEVNSYASVSVVNPAPSSSIYYNFQNTNSSLITNGALFRFTPDSFPVAPPVNIVSTASASCITISFEDNSTNECLFEIWRSIDSVNYTLLDTIVSHSAAAIGEIYSYTDTALFYSTIYNYRIIPRSFGGMINSWGAITDTTTTPSLSGVKYIPGDYASIGDALEDIKCKRLAGPIILQLKSVYSPFVESYPIIMPGDTITSAINTITIRPDVNVTNQMIYWANLTSIFDFNHSSNIIIDGRPGGIGNSGVLTIKNIQSNAPALRFINDAHDIAVRYCTIISPDSLTDSGIIEIAGTGLTNGNDRIVIEQCDIGYASYRPVYLITSTGTVGKENDSICILNCLLHNFYRGGNNNQNTSAINIGLGNTNWLIKGNSFYQNSITTAAAMSFIRIDNVNGNDFEISDNYFGGTGPMCSGANCVFNGSGLLRFIYLNVGNASGVSIQNNVFDNFTLNINTSLPINYIIQLVSGDMNVGFQQGNRFGSNSGSPSIFLLNIGDLNVIQSQSWDSLWICNNTISGIKATGSASHSICGAYLINASYLNFGYNVIGHPYLADAITSYSTGEITAIEIVYPRNGGLIYIHDNIIANIGLYNIVLQTSNSIVGISSHNGIIAGGDSHFLIEKNVIHSFIFWGSNAGPEFDISGIAINFNLGSTDIVANNVFDFQHLGVATGAAINGISAGSEAGGIVNIEANFVHTFSIQNSTSSYIRGICSSSRGRIYNNMVRLGYLVDGSSFQGSTDISGIYLYAASSAEAKSIFHNSICIGGITNIQQSYSSAINAQTNNYTDSIYNNIICNTRSNLIGAGIHNYGIISTAANTSSIDNNLYYCTGNLSSYVNSYTSFSSWQSTGKDINSLVGDPAFINSSGDTSNVDLHLQTVTWAEGIGNPMTTVFYDFDGQLRSAYSPVDVGADCGNFLSTVAELKYIESQLYAIPNPFVNSFLIQSASPIKQIEIYRMDGSMVLFQEIDSACKTKQFVNMYGQSSGFYYAVVTYEDNTLSHIKICKAN